MKFLVDTAFTTPTWMIDEEILRRIEPVGVIDRIRTAQNRVLTALLNSARFARLVEQETLDGNLAYSPVEFLASVRKGIWQELDAPAVKIDPYRRELQRSYLNEVNTKLNPVAERAATARFPDAGRRGAAASRASNSGDEKPMYRAELRALAASISGRHGQDHGSRNQSAPGSQPGRDRQDPRSQVRASGARRCRHAIRRPRWGSLTESVTSEVR